MVMQQRRDEMQAAHFQEQLRQAAQVEELHRQMRENTRIEQLWRAAQVEEMQRQLHEHERYRQQHQQVQPQDLFGVNDRQSEDEESGNEVDSSGEEEQEEKEDEGLCWPQPIDFPADTVANVPQAFICRISHDNMREPLPVCATADTRSLTHTADTYIGALRWASLDPQQEAGRMRSNKWMHRNKVRRLPHRYKQMPWLR